MINSLMPACDFKKTAIDKMLDKNKTYGYYTCTDAGKHNIFQKFVSKRIQSHSRHVLEEEYKKLNQNSKYKYNICNSDVAVHAGFCRYEYDEKEKRSDWWFYESHYDTKGVKRKDCVEFIHCNGVDMHDTHVYFFEDEFDFEFANELVGTPYGTIDLFRMALDDYANAIFGIPINRKWVLKPDSGLWCSEYYALCQVDKSILKYFELEQYKIKVSHIQAWTVAVKKDIQEL